MLLLLKLYTLIMWLLGNELWVDLYVPSRGEVNTLPVSHNEGLIIFIVATTTLSGPSLEVMRLLD